MASSTATRTRASANGKLPNEPAEIPHPVLADTMDFIDRFVVLNDDQLLVISLWAIHTWAVDLATQTPYMIITSPEMRCGKSRLLETLELLVCRPWQVELPSEAVLYRYVDGHKPTLLLDEADTIFAPSRKGDRYESIRALLNAGHRQGGVVPRCVGNSHTVVNFNVFCAKAIAGIGSLPATVADRGVPIRLQRKTPQEHVEQFRLKDEQAGAEALTGRIKEWVEGRDDELKEARPDMPDHLSDRLQEGCEPLVAIAELMGYGAAARRALIALCTEERVDNVDSVRLRLLRDIQCIFTEREDEVRGRIKGMASTRLLSRLRALPESEWTRYYGRGLEAKDLSALLRPYGVSPTTIRFKSVPKKGYRRSDLVQVWERYV